MSLKVACSWRIQNVPGDPPPAIGQLAETGVIRIRHGWIGRLVQAALVKKDEAGMVRTVECPESEAPVYWGYVNL